MPFESEGPIRSGNAVEALTRLRAAAETTLVFPLDRLHATMSKDSPLVQLMRDVERHMAAPVYALAALDTWPGSAVICRGTADACLEIRDAVDLLLAAGWGTAAEAASKRGEGMQETLAAAMSHPLIREWLPLPERSLLVGCLPETCAADEFLQAWQAVRSRRVDGAPHLVSLGSLPERVTPGVRAFVVVAGRDCRPVRIGL
jgi:cell division GTPase FtsZ